MNSLKAFTRGRVGQATRNFGVSNVDPGDYTYMYTHTHAYRNPILDPRRGQNSPFGQNFLAFCLTDCKSERLVTLVEAEQQVVSLKRDKKRRVNPHPIG